ncbi:MULTISPECIES: hypothetical protein [Vibrio harveyi group]|uniref:Uncharacterized protein n=1 Tax=Vibrio parahaemolyticus TaxID=670 RepID=A0AA47LA54_VIBPH|nr:MULTISPECIES: hypothetical protein [Vibrio harveyi group]ARR10477.1 cell envelope biogenesis protein OmpA [Vibrio campbellii]MCR9907816.1 hypothetical protein [Vibrio campbellii]WAT93870.1 hypothetical protein O1Q84_26735 [Vibrio parahaemolyticus]
MIEWSKVVAHFLILQDVKAENIRLDKLVVEQECIEQDVWKVEAMVNGTELIAPPR